MVSTVNSYFCVAITLVKPQKLESIVLKICTISCSFCMANCTAMLNVPAIKFFIGYLKKKKIHVISTCIMHSVLYITDVMYHNLWGQLWLSG